MPNNGNGKKTNGEDKSQLAKFWRNKALEELDFAAWCEIAYEAEKHLSMPEDRLNELLSKWRGHLKAANEAQQIAEEIERE